MRTLAVFLLILGLMVGSTHAAVLVSPIIFEADNITKGEVLRLEFTGGTAQSEKMQLSLALFDQASDGSIYFLEEPESIRRASSIVQVDTEPFLLKPREKKTFALEILDDSFSSAYVVVFVNSKRDDGINTRKAILLLLSTIGAKEEMTVVELGLQGGIGHVTFQNNGNRHGILSGQMTFYDASGTVIGEKSVTSGIVLPQRSRSAEFALPPYSTRFDVNLTEVRSGI